MATGRKLSASLSASVTIGIVTVTYNSAGVLTEFLRSLAIQTHTAFHLYVIDNASTDQTSEICMTFHSFRLTYLANNVNLGVAEGNNQGIRAALQDGCEHILLINNDTAFDCNLLDQLLKGLTELHCDMITPKICYYDAPNKIWAAGGEFQPWLGYRVRHYGVGAIDTGQFEIPRTITYAPTCCVLIKSSVFHHIGIMDPLYFVYADDADFMYRAYKAGIVMKYLPKSKLLHKVSSLTGGATSPFTTKYCTRNRIYFTKKNLSPIYAHFWILLYRGYLLLRYLTGRDQKSQWEWKRAAAEEGMNLGNVKLS